jgi:hypothetical protein
MAASPAQGVPSPSRMVACVDVVLVDERVGQLVPPPCYAFDWALHCHGDGDDRLSGVAITPDGTLPVVLGAADASGAAGSRGSFGS